MALSVGEKIDKIVASGWPIAWDGCHKIYFLEDKVREAQARRIGYTIYPAGELPRLISESCGLVFVSRWGFDNDDFKHDLNIEQCEPDIYDEAESRMR